MDKPAKIATFDMSALKQLINKIWLFGKTKIEKLFNSLDVEDLLNEWINQLKLAEFDMSALKQLVNKSDEFPLKMHHIIWSEAPYRIILLGLFWS